MGNGFVCLLSTCSPFTDHSSALSPCLASACHRLEAPSYSCCIAMAKYCVLNVDPYCTSQVLQQQCPLLAGWLANIKWIYPSTEVNSGAPFSLQTSKYDLDINIGDIVIVSSTLHPFTSVILVPALGQASQVAGSAVTLNGSSFLVWLPELQNITGTFQLQFLSSASNATSATFNVLSACSQSGCPCSTACHGMHASPRLLFLQVVFRHVLRFAALQAFRAITVSQTQLTGALILRLSSLHCSFPVLR